MEPEITELLKRWAEGEESAFDTLFPLVYGELHKLSKGYLRKERRDHTLQTTALVHEAYLRLLRANKVEWHSRSHFYAISARIMRQILVDFARKRGYEKRGGGKVRVDLEGEPEVRTLAIDEDILALDEAVSELSEFDPRKGSVVELRFFGGLNIAETAEVLGVSTESIKRDWRLAKSWLRTRLQPEVPDGS